MAQNPSIREALGVLKDFAISVSAVHRARIVYEDNNNDNDTVVPPPPPPPLFVAMNIRCYDILIGAFSKGDPTQDMAFIPPGESKISLVYKEWAMACREFLLEFAPLFKVTFRRVFEAFVSGDNAERASQDALGRLLYFWGAFKDMVTDLYKGFHYLVSFSI